MSRSMTAVKTRKKTRRKAVRSAKRSARAAPKGPTEGFAIDLAPAPSASPRSAALWRGPVAELAKAPVAVRATTPADATAIAALWSALSRLHATFGEEWAVGEGAAERYARAVSAAAGRPNLLYLAAEVQIEGEWRFVGFLHAAIKTRGPVYREILVGEIPEVCVVPGACGRGIGAELITGAMDWFRKKGVSHVEAAIPAGNLAARAFFSACGFRESASLLWTDVPPSAAGAVPIATVENQLTDG